MDTVAKTVAEMKGIPTQEELLEQLRKDTLVVTFNKLDGDERIMTCTKSFDVIPEENKPKTDKPVSVNLSAGLQDVSIKRGFPRNVTLSPLSPSVFKYIHDQKEIKRVRVHVKRAHNDVKKVTSGCSMVSVQTLDEPVNNLEDVETSKNPWQTMLGQSIIDVNVGEFITGSRKQRKRK